MVMNRIESIKELDEIIENANTVQWNRLKGFYNKITKREAYNLIDHIDAVSSLYKALKRKNYRVSNEAIHELINLYKDIEVE